MMALSGGVFGSWLVLLDHRELPGPLSHMRIQNSVTQKKVLTLPCGIPDLRLPVRNKFLLFVSCSVCGIYTTQDGMPEGTPKILKIIYKNVHWFLHV